MAAFPPPEKFAPNQSPAEDWERWRKKFTMYHGAAELTGKTEEIQRDILLYVMGEAGQEIYENLNVTEPLTGKVVTILDALSDYFKPYRNEVYKRHELSLMRQKEGTSVDQFVMELTQKAKDCGYGDLRDSIIRDRLICGVRDNLLRERLLRQGDITLTRAIETCRADEILRSQGRIMEGLQEIHGVAKTSRYSEKKPTGGSTFNKKCRWCGKLHKPKQCPAYGKKCKKCNKSNHFAVVCKTNQKTSDSKRQVSTIEQASSSLGNLLIGEITVANNKNNWIEELKINTDRCLFKLDSGSDVNILPVRMYDLLTEKPKIIKCDVGLQSYSNHTLPVLGICTLKCKTRIGIEQNIEFIVMNTHNKGILGRQTCENLELLRRVAIIERQINDDQVTAQKLVEQFKDVFQGLGKLPGTHHITIKSDAQPHATPARRIPLVLQGRVKQELQNMVGEGIIEKIDEPTNWVHPMLIRTKKGGGLRICLDPRLMNKSIQREHVQIPTHESLTSEIKGARIFTVLDASKAFHQIQLDEASSELCTFATPEGRYKFLRLPFGLCSAPEVFQNAINNALRGIDGISCYFDDILIYGATQQQHDSRLEKVLKRARELNLKFDRAKMQLSKTEVTYLGHMIGPNGTNITLDRTKAIRELHTPRNKQELRRFLGMVGFLTKFIKNLSSKTAYLRELLKNDTVWNWDAQATRDFDKIKELVEQAPLLIHFDQTQSSTITADASKDGMGAALLQNKGPIAYNSSAFTKAQCNYSQIEKELLAIVIGCEKFHYYVYGMPLRVETDHKPLVNLVNKPLEKLSPRLQRMVVRLQRYQPTITYVPGKTQYISDTLSRDTTTDVVNTKYLEGNDVVVHSIITASESKMQTIRTATKDDPDMQRIMQYTCEGWPKYVTQIEKKLKKYWTFRDEIHVNEGLLYRGDRLIIPEVERCEILKKIHQTHEGIVASKNRAREGLYWPGISQDIETFIKSCKICLSKSKTANKEPILPHKIPPLPWYKIGIDFMELKGSDYIIAIDYYSKYVHIEHIKGKTADKMIHFIKRISATHGIPQQIMSDNGPPFDSRLYQDFLKINNIQQITSSPQYSQSNGMVERMVQTVKGRLEKTLLDGGDHFSVQLNYNSTKHNALKSPAELIMGRKLRTLLPTTDIALQPEFDTQESDDQLKLNQALMKARNEQTSRELAKLHKGDQVFYRHTSQNWRPATVVETDISPRSYKLISSTGQHFRRNRKHIKLEGKGIEMAEHSDSAKTLEHSDSANILEHSDSANILEAKQINTTIAQQGQLDVTPMAATQTVDNAQVKQTVTGTRKTTRSVKTPVKFNDFVMY